jgi:general secretion pathway protein M
MGFRQALIDFWQARSSRERGTLVAAAAFALAAALYGLLWDPGIRASARLSGSLPRLRAQVEDMRHLQKEILQLRKGSGTTPAAADLRALLRAAVARSPLAGTAHSLESQPNDRVVFIAPSIDFDSWLQWVGGMQRELGVRLDTCRVSALEQPGRVRIEASFVATGAGARGP